jgi:protein-glutamine gamma-glutamyltransferase
MSPTGRPEGEYRSAQREGNPLTPTGRPEGEYRSAQREGNPLTPTGRPEGEYRSAKRDSPVSARRKPSRAAPRTPLSAAQIRWLGIFLLATLLPQAPFVPIWVAGFGTMLVALRMLLLQRDRLRADTKPARIPSWALALFAVAAGIAIRQSFGYFLGRDPCVAFLFVLSGIKYLEARSARDGTLLVCLASFQIVTPFFYTQSLLAALAAMPALVVLGIVLQVSAQPSLRDLPLASWRAPFSRTIKLFAQGIPLAAVLFVLFPRLAGPMWGLPTDAGSKSGLSEQMAPGSISELSMSDAVAFRVDFDGAVPPSPQRYWRGPVMSRFDGREWIASEARTPRTPRLRRPAGRVIGYWVTLEPHWKSWLFALDLPADPPMAETGANAGPTTSVIGDLTGDQRIFARSAVTQPLRYRQTSIPADAYTAGDGDALENDRTENLQLPFGGRNPNPRTVAFARELRAQHPDDADYIRTVLRWFRAESFYYTLAPPLLSGANPVDAFLFDQRRGFCEHYASSFVVLLRAAGIPARVVTGYQGGEINPSGGYLIVRQSDAHAWAEAMLDGKWRRFDPTGAVAPSRIERGLGAALPTSEFVPLLARLDPGWIKSVQLAWDAFNYDWRRHVVGFNYDKQRSLWREWSMDRLPPALVTAIVAGLIGLWGAGTLGLISWWRRRSGDRARLLWDAVCRRLANAGLPRRPHEGPLAFGARASARWPEFDVAFRVIAESYAILRYGPPPATSSAQRQREAALARLARAIAVLPAPAVLRSAPALS